MDCLWVLPAQEQWNDIFTVCYSALHEAWMGAVPQEPPMKDMGPTRQPVHSKGSAAFLSEYVRVRPAVQSFA